MLLNICIALIVTVIKDQRKTDVTVGTGYITVHDLLEKGKKNANKNYSS